MRDWDFDEAVTMLEELFDEIDQFDEEELVVNMELVLARAGADDLTDPADVVEAISTAAHNASVQHLVAPLIGL